jgi:hypothetical protein
VRLRLCGSNGTLPALAASLHTQERAHHTQERILLTEAHPSTAVGPLWSPSTLLRCAAKRMRTASGLGEAAAKLLACACGGVWPCGRVASPFLANTAVRSILLQEIHPRLHGVEVANQHRLEQSLNSTTVRSTVSIDEGLRETVLADKGFSILSCRSRVACVL